MHPKLLFDVIQRQAGTLEKAILELVMNAADAGATRCDIFVRDCYLGVTDDGKGFRTREEVENFFECFGQPHDPSEGKVYGTFRMGRGQAFSFGANTWRTGKFEMVVDIKNKGLDYELKTNLPKHTGCKIDIQLYQSIYPSDIARIRESLAVWVKYCPITVTLNDSASQTDPGAPITVATTAEKWPQETSEAYIRLTPQGSLKVYNLGILVREYPNYDYGTGGVVVSKKQLQVNFARNDVQSDCLVWKAIKTVVDKKATESNRSKKTLSDDQRRRMLRQLVTGELSYDEVADRPLIKLCTGKCVTLASLALASGSLPVSVCRTNDRIGDALTRRGMATVLSEETLDWFGAGDLRAFVSRVKTIRNEAGHRCDPTDLSVVTPFEKIAKRISNVHTLEKLEDATENQQLWITIARKGMYVFSEALRKPSTWAHSTHTTADYRRIELGESATSLGWTDGSSYVAVSKLFLSGIAFTLEGFGQLGALLLHEWCHQDPDIDDHDHDQAFYEKFHDNAGTIGHFVQACLQNLPAILDANKRKMSKVMLKQQDRLAQTTQRGVNVLACEGADAG